MEKQPPASKSLRVMELLLVTSVAFAGTILVSVSSLFSNALASNPQGGQALVFYSLIYELIALAVLFYVLFRQGRSLRQIGLSFSLLDIPVSVLLAVIAYVAFYLCHLAVNYGYPFLTGRVFTQPDQVQTYVGTGISIGSILLAVINPIYEELIARAYTISEVNFLTGSSAIAVISSVALQVLYHLYQGTSAAIGLGAMFVILSIYFVKYGRIVPIILAHLYFDVLALLIYARH